MERSALRFIKKASGFAAVLIITLIILDTLSMVSPINNISAAFTGSRQFFMTGAVEITPCIDKVSQQDGTTALIIGDSICGQLFNGLQDINPDITIAGSNGAITIAGQYMLAMKYIENHPDATDIYLFYLPESFWRGYNATLGYPYAVMPFAQKDCLKYLDDDTLDILGSVYGKPFITPKGADLLGRSGVNLKLYLNTLNNLGNEYQMSYPFEFADRYLIRLNDECLQRGIEFHLYPCPVCETSRELNDSFKDSFEESKTRTLNPEYYDMVVYYPAEQSADGEHFAGEYANQEHYNDIIREAYAQTDLLDSLNLTEGSSE
ncbi:hypothetical protein SAMN02910292_00815 [Lachnospiraceae bacterium XBB2008]|nr:hypothetical protein SAMN02910292_00815 [Lachnospiraceae bacterium XBB2008]